MLVLMATSDVAHKCENVNYSFYTAIINATVVHNQHFKS